MRKDLKKKKKKTTKTALYEETGKALGTSVRSVRTVVNEFDKDNQIVSPKKRNTPNPFPKVTDLMSMQYAELCMIFIKQMNLLHSRKSMLP